jgi:hypothetical protein
MVGLQNRMRRKSGECPSSIIIASFQPTSRTQVNEAFRPVPPHTAAAFGHARRADRVRPPALGSRT